jgi:hypothetical protein
VCVVVVDGSLVVCIERQESFCVSGKSHYWFQHSGTVTTGVVPHLVPVSTDFCEIR